MRSCGVRLRRFSDPSMRATLRQRFGQVNTSEPLTKLLETKAARNFVTDASDSPRMSDDAVRSKLAALEIETPSWGYGNSGTRFHVYPWPGAARTVWERIDDAALVHRLTGCCPSVALHIPWDRVDDWAALRDYANVRGIRIGAINPNLFGDDAYRLGMFHQATLAPTTQAGNGSSVEGSTERVGDTGTSGRGPFAAV